MLIVRATGMVHNVGTEDILVLIFKEMFRKKIHLVYNSQKARIAQRQGRVKTTTLKRF